MGEMLSHAQARRFYDRMGRRQDWQGFYENAAKKRLAAQMAFSSARSVVEFGCGTAGFADTLLRDELPAEARYLGIDISPTMVDLARRRLVSWGERAEIRRSEGGMDLELESASADRFVSIYVLDLLTRGDIRHLLAEAHRVLTAGGLLGLVSLTPGFTPFSRLVSRTWSAVHAWRPSLVGGCRPIRLDEFVDGPRWAVRHRSRVSSFGVPSEVLVAAKLLP